MPKVSYSEVKLGRKCMKAHNYRYVQNLQKKRPNRPAFAGTILHEMLHNWVRARQIPHWKDDPWDILAKYEREYKKLFREEQEEFGDVPSMVAAIFEGYLRRWRHDGWTYEDSEVSVITDLTPDLRFLGIIDKIIIDKNGRRFLVDHKFNRVIPGPQERFADIQTVLYFWAWNQSHRPAKQLDGIIWDYGRQKAPAIPQLLKTGGLTQRANIDTDAYTYRKAIRDNNLSEKPYRKILTALEGKERSFFERVPLPAPPKKLVETIVEDVRASAVIFKHLTKQGVAPRSMSAFNCNNCDFRTLCEAEVRGLDANFVRKRDFQIKEHSGDWNDGTENREEV